MNGYVCTEMYAYVYKRVFAFTCLFAVVVVWVCLCACACERVCVRAQGRKERRVKFILAVDAIL